MRWLVASLLLMTYAGVGLAEESPVVSGRQYVEIRWGQEKVPSIELTKDNVPVITLPQRLQDAISRHFSEWRLPGNQDYEGGDWEAFYDYVSPEERKKGLPTNPERLKRQRAPFIAIGDFNADKTPDIALLLANVKDSKLWQLVIFHGTATGYQPFVPLVSFDKKTKRPKLGDMHGYGIATEDKCADWKQCVELYRYEASSFHYVWKNGRYVEINVSD